MKLTACILTRNEAAFLPGCLQSLRGFDEIVIADTGSSDATVKIAQDAGAKVVAFPWQDDFAAARNFCKSHATGDWIFWIDSDERLMQGMGGLMNALLTDPATADPKLMALGVWVYSPVLDGTCLFPPNPQTEMAATGSFTLYNNTVRLHRNLPEIVFNGRVHETVEESVAALGGHSHPTCLGLLHEGYRESHMAATQKLRRNLKLLRAAEAETPTDGVTLYNLARTLSALGQSEWTAAADAFDRADRHSAPDAAWRSFMARDRALFETRRAEAQKELIHV